jgi:hypothetical protein
MFQLAAYTKKIKFKKSSTGNAIRIAKIDQINKVKINSINHGKLYSNHHVASKFTELKNIL